MNIHDVADAVLALIQGASLSMSVTARRSWSPRSTTSELTAGSVVNVVPAAVRPGENARTRGRTREELVIEIGVQKKITGGNEDAQIDAVIELANEIKALFTVDCITSAIYAPCIECVHEPIIDGEHLHSQRLITSLLTARFLDGT